MASLYADVVEGWAQLPDVVRRVQAPGCAVGRFDVERGQGWIARVLARLSGLPPAGRDVPVTLTVTESAGGELWERRFGTFRLTTSQRAVGRGSFAEQMGPVECVLATSVAGQALTMQSTGAVLRLGPLRLPLPRLLAPSIVARISGDHDAASVDVQIRSGWGTPLVRYVGRVRPQ